MLGGSLPEQVSNLTAMDMNTRPFHTSGMIGSSISIFPQSKAEKIPVSLGDYMPTSSVGFTRYHNQAAVVEHDCSVSHNTELSQNLGHRQLASARDPGLSLQPNKNLFKDKGHENYSNTGNMQAAPFMLSSGGSGSFLQHIPPDPYGAILENGEEQVVSQTGQLSPGERNSQRLRLTPTDLQFNVLPSAVKPNLIRQNSLPADVLSRLGMEESCERPLSQQIGSQMHSMAHGNPDDSAGKFYLLPSKASPQAAPVRNCYMDASNNRTKTGETWYTDGELRNNGLIRHSSSPAGLLSQLSAEEYPGQGMGARKELGLMPGHRLSVWDEDSIDSEIQNIAAFGQRKRGRDADAVFKSLQASDTLRMGQQLDHFTLVGAPGADGIGSDSTICKVRAKRGCATHPRSIAERVRRTKISERMRKLQDLVPNLDKQAHTADMLDEVVEYVKHLQRQVQELSENACECNGSCQNKEKNS